MLFLWSKKSFYVIGGSMVVADPEKIHRSPTVGPSKPRLLGVLGPGLITGASDDDPSGIATYSQAGAQFGYQVSWSKRSAPALAEQRARASPATCASIILCGCCMCWCFSCVSPTRSTSAPISVQWEMA